MAKVNRGFTLIELMIVMAIIGMVATLGIGSYQISLKRARDAQRKTDLQQIRSALEIYRTDINVYPSTGGTYQIQGCGTPCGVSPCAWGNAWTCGGSTYMEKLPADPKSPTVNYRYSSNGSTYTLEACLENKNDPQATSPTLGWDTTTCPTSKVFQVKNP
jgi:general secretion pathway protein G